MKKANKMILFFVPTDEPIELATFTGDNLDEIIEKATEYLISEGLIPEDTMEEWEPGEKDTLWLTLEDEDSGLEINFTLEPSAN